jgi:hypothetical protein
MQDDYVDPDYLLEPFARIVDVLASILIAIITVFLKFLEGLLVFFLSLSDTILGKIVIILFVIALVGGIIGEIYEANFGKNSTDKIMENKNKTGFFHPENIEKNVEEELGLVNLRKQHLWFTGNMPLMDLTAPIREKSSWKISVPVYDDEDVNIEPETVIKFTDVYCGNCYLPIEKEEVFCGNCGSLIKEATKKFLEENSWDENVRKT